LNPAPARRYRQPNFARDIGNRLGDIDLQLSKNLFIYLIHGSFCFHLLDSLISGSQTLKGVYRAENSYFSKKQKLFQNILRDSFHFLKTTTNFTNPN